MRRIVIALSLVAAVVGLYSCAADAPTRPPTSGGGTPSNAVSVQLFTSDANPRAGSCTLITATASLNGSPVPDDTTISFSTDFGSFSQNGLPIVAVVTNNGAASTALCGPGEGPANVKATVTVSNKTNSAKLLIQFHPDAGTLPFVSSCNPSLGGVQGGDSVTLNGGNFFGSASTSRVAFTANGVTRPGIVTAVNANSVVVQTAGFPELTAASTPATITLTLGTNLPQPVVLSLPNCFTYGTAQPSTPTISALLPSSGTNEGNTRVTIIGSGFSTKGVQVFFGAVEATVVSTSFNQVVCLSPPAFGAGAGNLNQTVPVTVKNVDSGNVSNGVSFRFTPAIQITAISSGVQNIDVTFQQVTIYGQGFQAPVAVTLAGVPALVQSVSATEILVTPGFPLVESCSDVTGAVSVTNINSGDTASGLAFRYVVPQMVITGIAPQTDGGVAGVQVTITGNGFPSNPADADVKFGTKTAFVNVAASSKGILVVTAPAGSVVLAPACVNSNPVGTLQTVETEDVTVTNRISTCSATVAQSFNYQLPCVLATATPAAP